MQFLSRLVPASAPAAAKDDVAPMQAHAADDAAPTEHSPGAAEAAAAVAAIEADLAASFEQMTRVEHEPVSPAKLQLKAGIGKVMAQQQIVRLGFRGEKHFEQEGTDAVLFNTVPAWISFEKISGYRYRRITSIADTADDFELYTEGVSFYGSPGASGWADKIGDVAIHYMSAEWAVFSKIFPFPEQSVARETHEDVLLLGSTRHVMLTPICAYSITQGGLGARDTGIACLGGEGGILKKAYSVDSVPQEVLRRLYLTWGHEESDYAVETVRFKFELHAVLEAHVSAGEKAKRWLGSIATRIGGHKVVHEHWVRYPALPLEPWYFTQLLATATSATEDEQRTRAIMEAQPTPRGESSDAVAVEIGALNA